MLLAIDFPSWLKPEIIPSLPFRWYGLMYIFAFGTAFLLYRRQVKERNFPLNDDELSGLFFWGILSLILGARIFHSLVYVPDAYYILRPHLIFWPFRDGVFTGLEGMSYHGGVIGGILSIIIYCKVKKIDAREIGDMYAASIPLGYTFGRLGNFINGELFGRITAKPWGMIFPHGGIFPWQGGDFDRIRHGAEELGIKAVEGPMGMLNFPRHPSQIYEMILEGIFLWGVIWFFRNRKPFKGFLISLYLSGYGFMRFFIEYFREPDSGIGYPLQFVRTNVPPALGHHPLNFTTGQIFCFAMIVAGVLWGFAASRMSDSKPLRVYPAEGEKQISGTKEKSAGRRNRGKKMRKRLM